MKLETFFFILRNSITPRQKYCESNMISTIKILTKLKNGTLLTVWPQNEQPSYVGEPLTSPTVTCANNDNP